MEELKTCPLCGNENFTHFLSARDHFLSRESFTIVQCHNCNLKFTNPRPDESVMPRYYESEEYISHDTRQKSLLHSLYKFARNIAVRNKYNIIRKYSNGFSLLDIGCGTGEVLNYCSKKNFQTTGIEPSEKARNFAATNYGLQIFDESHLDHLPDHSYHVITMWHVLEHVHNLNARLKKIHDLLIPGGALIVAVPDCDSWDAKKYGDYWAAYDLPRHLYHFSQETIKTLMAKNDFRVQKIIPMKMDAFYISLLSHKYLSGRQNYFKAIFNGIRSDMHAGKNNRDYSSLIYICKIAQEVK